MTLEQGDLLNNRYKILDILGRGGMGSVYHAIDESLGVEVAVKENLFITADYEKQFRLEAVILASLRHANLPRVTDHFTIEGQGQYLVMDYIEGRDLRHLMESGPLPEAEAVRIGIAVCDALTYLHTHKRPVLHRDIKPGNVRIAADGHVYLVDFGLAKMSNLDEHTLSGARAMTPGYSPPEQYGTSRTDARTDVYSLGATLYAAMTGYIPEDGLARVVDEVKLTPLRKRNPKISPQVASVIEKAMEPQSNNRYQSAEEFERALKGMTPTNPEEKRQASEPLPVVVVTPPAEEKTPTERIVKQGTSPATWIVLLALLVASAFGANWVLSNPQNAQEYFQALLALVISPTPTSPATITPETDPRVTPVNTKNVVVPASITQTATKPLKTSTPSSSPTVTLSPTPVATIMGGGLGEIAFASIRDGLSQIYLINADGSNLHALTNEINGACQPNWSPDGKKLVYIAPCATKSDQYLQSSLFMLDLETNQKTQLTSTSGGDFEPAWSPDGTKIAFASLRDGFLTIYALNINDLTDIKLLIPLSSIAQSRQPAWSPDGKQIVYTVKRFGLLQIWMMDADGSNQRQVIRNGGGSSDYLPVWSPDGSHILFSQSNSKATSPSYLMRFAVNSGQPAEAISVPLPIVDVNFSPDGQWIAYETAAENQDIYIYNLFDGAPPRPLTNDTSIDFDPAWRP